MWTYRGSVGTWEADRGIEFGLSMVSLGFGFWWESGCEGQVSLPGIVCCGIGGLCKVTGDFGDHWSIVFGKSGFGFLLVLAPGRDN